MSDNVIAKATVNFGKIVFTYGGRKINSADVEVELDECGGDATYDCHGRATRERVASQFSMDEYIGKLITIYTEVSNNGIHSKVIC